MTKFDENGYLILSDKSQAILDDIRKNTTRKYETASYKKRMSDLSKELWNDIDYRERVKQSLEKTRTDEYKNKISASLKKVWENDPSLHQKMSEVAKERWEDPEYHEKMVQASKARWEDPEYREKMAAIRLFQLGKVSSIQKLLYKLLDNLEIEYEQEGPNTKVGYYVFDCLAKTVSDKPDILIECQGNYWHSQPKAVASDRSKFTYIDRYFPEYEIMYIWEHEFYAKDRVLDRLKLKLGLTIDMIDFEFSDITIKKLKSKDIKMFLDAYHYIGKGRGGTCYGAYCGSELVACCVFSSPIRQNMNGLFGDFVELSRFCIHPNYHKKNFASWFISRCIKLIKTNIIAYADTTVGHIGTIYKASNFKYHHIVPADYWYVDGGGYVMHKKTLYDKAKKMGITEKEFADRNEYFKKYGGQKVCYIKGVE